MHDPAKVLLDLALTLALGGDTCSDLAVVRAEPAVFGPVASCFTSFTDADLEIAVQVICPTGSPTPVCTDAVAQGLLPSAAG